MMKIVFIEPQSKYSSFSFGWISKLPFLGPVYLATILKNRGHDVEIYKESIKPIKIEKIKADVLCLHSLTSSSRRAYQIATEFKKLNPNSRVIIGGIHASLMPEEAIKYADQVVVGEAESIIVDVIEGKYKDKIVYGSRIQDLDKLPFPDFSLIKYLKGSMFYHPITTSRGCPFNCNFCSVTEMFGRKYRFRSEDNVIAELAKQKYKRIFFYDDNFTALKPRAKNILKKMYELRLDRPWMAQVRADVAKDDELLRLMSKTNCDYLIIGFESINPKSLKFYNKHQELKDIKYNIKKLQENNIKIYGFFVFGSDFDTTKVIRDTVDFCDDMDLARANFTALTPLPGTKLYDLFSKQKRIFTKRWDLYDLRHVIFKPKLMSPYELQYELNEAFRKTYWLTKRGFRIVLENLNNTPAIIKELISYQSENNKYLDFLRTTKL